MDLGNAKILIGDDSILARKQLKDCIAALGGSNFIEAANGQEAIDKYKSEQPDIVFLDIVMPIKDGIIATQEIHDKSQSMYYHGSFRRNHTTVKSCH